MHKNFIKNFIPCTTLLHRANGIILYVHTIEQESNSIIFWKFLFFTKNILLDDYKITQIIFHVYVPPFPPPFKKKLILSNILRPFTLKTMEKNDFLEKQKMHRKTEIIFNNKTLRAKSTKNIFHLIKKKCFYFSKKETAQKLRWRKEKRYWKM